MFFLFATSSAIQEKLASKMYVFEVYVFVPFRMTLKSSHDSSTNASNSEDKQSQTDTTPVQSPTVPPKHNNKRSSADAGIPHPLLKQRHVVSVKQHMHVQYCM